MSPSFGRKFGWRAGIALMLAAAATVSAEEPPFDVEAELKALRAEVAALRAKDTDLWMSERRAEEIKTLIQKVLSDAETRASLAEGGMTAGWKSGHPFIATEDGNWYIELGGHFQGRYVANFAEDNDLPDASDTSFDKLESGFLLRRAKFKFEGHIFDPKIEFEASLAAERGRFDYVENVDEEALAEALQDAGFLDTEELEEAIDDALERAAEKDGGKTMEFEDYFITYEFADGWEVQFGRWKRPFARQNMISSSRQMAVERSSVMEAFPVDRSEGVMITYSGDMIKGYFSVNDGQRAETTDFYQDCTDFAFTARGELLLAGDWGQFRDFNAWSGEEFGAMVGGTFHYELGETGNGQTNLDFYKWTADVGVEVGGLGLRKDSHNDADDQFAIRVQYQLTF